MYEFMVASQESDEVKIIIDFLKWKNIKYKLIISESDVLFLNQGNDSPLFMEDHMIIARGFYNIVDYVKNGMKRL